MLWHKSWRETRWRFIVGLAVLVLSACGTVFDYPAVVKLIPLATAVDTSAPLGRLIKQAAEVERDYRGFVWWQWFRQNLAEMWTLFAVILGSGGLLSQGGGGAALFTLSLPVSRNRVLGVRAGTGLAELAALAFVPSLVIPLLSPLVGQRYGVGDTLVHAACLFVAGAMFFSLALLLSTVFSDLWRPLLLACAAALLVAACEQIVAGSSEYGVFRLMSGERYFRRGAVPWVGLLAAASASAAMLWAAAANFARRDF